MRQQFSAKCVNFRERNYIIINKHIGNMNQKGVRFVMVVAIVALQATMVKGQNTLPDILLNGTLSEQMNYVESKTRI